MDIQDWRIRYFAAREKHLEALPFTPTLIATPISGKGK